VADDALSVPPTSTTSSALARTARSAQRYVLASKAPSTLRAYRSDLRDFGEWCDMHAATTLPAHARTVALYIAALADAGAKVSTIQRRLSAISQAHQAAGHAPSPTADAIVRMTMAGIRRELGTAAAQKDAVLTADLRRLLSTADRTTAAGTRDRALLLLGFAGGFRRSELVALDVTDIEETPDGLRVRVRRSKTDQEGAGREVGIPWGQHPETCPIRALHGWREVGQIDQGPLFRPVDRHDRVAQARLTDRGVARVIQRAARAAGLDPSRYAGHSLRAGLATAAAAGGASERAIMAQTGHRSLTMVRRYIRSGTLFQENAAAYLGL
jgi:site-specific recombinase XerD